MSQQNPDSNSAWTLVDLLNLPPTVPARQADAILGMSGSTGKRMRALGTYPLPLLRIDRYHRVPTAALLALLGLPLVETSEPDGSMPVRLTDVGGLTVGEGAA